MNTDKRLRIIKYIRVYPCSSVVKKFLILILIVFGHSISPQELAEQESKPLLRVFPIFRPEECEWSIRFDICLRCMKKRERYAQRILFMKEGGPYREHGCYTDEKGFYILQ